MTDITLLLEVLRFLFLVYGIYRYYDQKQREKGND